MCKHWFFDAGFWLGPYDAYCIVCWKSMDKIFYEKDLKQHWSEMAEAINISPEG